MSKIVLSSPSRRTVLLAIAGGGAVVGGTLTVPGLREPRSDPPIRPRFSGTRKPLPAASFEQWQSEVGSVFYVATEIGALAVTLIEVAALPVVGRRPALLRTQPFELRFDAAVGTKLPAGDQLYNLRHANYGDFRLYFRAVDEALFADFN